MTITEFLHARLNEREAAARTAGNVRIYHDDYGQAWAESPQHGRHRLPDLGVMGLGEAALNDHLALNLPGRTLADCDAKRQIIALHTCTCPHDCGECPACSGPHGADYHPAPCDTLRALAIPYVDHPDYKPDWQRER